MASLNEIIELFSYTDEEQQAFAYIKYYMQRVTVHRRDIIKDRDMLKRYALAGLFLTYRSLNHQGMAISTYNIDEMHETIDKGRLKTLQDVFFINIIDTKDYLQMIKFNYFKYLFFFPGKALYNFVIKNR